MKALARGRTDRQIARELGISEKTVGNHASNIYRKLHIFDRTQAVIYAARSAGDAGALAVTLVRLV